MVGILKRMRRLKEVRYEPAIRVLKQSLTLLDVRLGPGAMIMKPQVTRLHMQFARKIGGGHMGPRKFWHQMLPRLKYHNPGIAMTVDRTDDQSAPATLIVYLAQGNVAAAPQEQPATEKEEIIDMKHKTEEDILNELTSIVDGQQVEPTQQEAEEMEALSEQRERSERDAVLQAEMLAKKKREQEILDQARRSAQVQAG